MAIYHLLEGSTFGPEEVRIMTEAYEIALRKLDIYDREGPLTDLVAKKIISIVKKGEADPATIATRALRDAGIPVPR
jgi:hypothetical protein